MERRVCKIIFGLGMILTALIRLPYWRQTRSSQVVVDRKTGREKSLLFFLGVGTFILPQIYLFTPLLKSANYRLRPWATWTGAVTFAAGLIVFWRAHATLGRYWSESLQLRREHELVTTGIYSSIRHPMYAFAWLMSIAQCLLLQNWIAGPSGLVSFSIFYFLRVPPEERMMLEQFGEEYRSYMNKTGRIIPRWSSQRDA